MKKILTILALILTIMVIGTFLYMQPRLVPQLEQLTPMLEGMSIFIVIAYFIMGIFHLVILKTALEWLSGRLLDSLFLTGVVFSGITLISDAVQLSEIGKEYLYWDVSMQWYFLYGFALVHLIVAVFAFIKVFNKKERPVVTGDALFYSLNQMLLIACSTGLAGIIISSIWMPVAIEFMATFIILAIGLSFAPVVLFILYWLWKKRMQSFSDWFDEKQLSDIARSALISFLFSLPVYFTAFTTEAMNSRIFPSYVWIMIIFFFQTALFSVSVLARTGRMGD